MKDRGSDADECGGQQQQRVGPGECQEQQTREREAHADDEREWCRPPSVIIPTTGCSTDAVSISASVINPTWAKSRLKDTFSTG